MLDKVFPNKMINASSLDFAYEIRNGIIEIAYTIKFEERIRDAAIRMLHCKDLLEFLLQEEELQAVGKTVVAALVIEVALQTLALPASAQLGSIIEAITSSEGIDPNELHRLRSHIFMCSAGNRAGAIGGGAIGSAAQADVTSSASQSEHIF